MDDGSSPHMRGKLAAVCGECICIRIIPAHAGQTPSACWSGSCLADHPRTCGANMVFAALSVASCGSSPHMRGKPAAYLRLRAHGRIIPAHAGQTGYHSTSARAGPDHPRTCGANSPVERTSSVFVDHPRTCGANDVLFDRDHVSPGSSPHMRGKPLAFLPYRVLLRIIPAHAGQTATTSSIVAPSPDHPRTCGANVEPYPLSNVIIGSSPHMRGKLHLHAARRQPVRIIPAHAGQTCRVHCGAAVSTDHPRTCGANHPHAHRRPRPHRIIPAHAGQTRGRADARQPDADHPRTCGANYT